MPTKNELETKYCGLVAFARKTTDDIENIYEVKKWYEEMLVKYPQECNDLKSKNESEWSHGFNSGILACLRLISGGKITDNNFEKFPCLNT